MSHLRIGELFAGYGGLGMGVQRAIGGEIAWFSEFDKGPSKILAHRFPGVPNHGDITKIDWSTVEPVDVLTGGSPCQDLSHAGKRSGMTEGTRSNLWVAMREAIAQLRPGLVVWENVRGAYSAEADSALEFCAGCMGDAWYRGAALRALGRVLGDLSDLGYVGGWHGLRAADIGAPHGRFRVFIIAHAASSDGWRGRRRREAEPERRAESGGRTPAVASVTLLPTPMVGDAASACNSTATRHKIPPTGLHAGDTLTDVIRGSREWGIYSDAIARWEALTRPAPAPTQPSKKGTPQLSAAFSEWMMGLPAGWVTDVPGITRNEALKALGNGVVPQQAEAALRFLLGAQAVAA